MGKGTRGGGNSGSWQAAAAGDRCQHGHDCCQLLSLSAAVLCSSALLPIASASPILSHTHRSTINPLEGLMLSCDGPVLCCR